MEYIGSCHCESVKFTLQTNLENVGQCNCSFCKRRNAKNDVEQALCNMLEINQNRSKGSINQNRSKSRRRKFDPVPSFVKDKCRDVKVEDNEDDLEDCCLLYTSPSPRD